MNSAAMASGLLRPAGRAVVWQTAGGGLQTPGRIELPQCGAGPPILGLHHPAEFPRLR